MLLPERDLISYVKLTTEGLYGKCKAGNILNGAKTTAKFDTKDDGYSKASFIPMEIDKTFKRRNSSENVHNDKYRMVFFADLQFDKNTELYKVWVSISIHWNTLASLRVNSFILTEIFLVFFV